MIALAYTCSHEMIEETRTNVYIRVTLYCNLYIIDDDNGKCTCIYGSSVTQKTNIREKSHIRTIKLEIFYIPVTLLYYFSIF